jgi:hypothetical protein
MNGAGIWEIVLKGNNLDVFLAAHLQVLACTVVYHATCSFMLFSGV